MTDAGRCVGTNKDGGACAARPLPGEQLCAWHHPKFSADRPRWQREAGRAKGHRAKARKQLETAGMSMSEVSGLLSVALRRVSAGQMEPTIGTALATIARAIVATQQAGAIEERIVALEEAAGLTERSA